jgi:cobalt transporter subunit CbtB
MLDPAAGSSATVSSQEATIAHQVMTEVSTGRSWPTIAAAALGILVVLGVGFSPGIAHNAAHDTRHMLVFPCH